MRSVLLTISWAIIFIPGMCGAQGGTWETLAPLSLARQETGAALLDGKVYVTGGLLSGNPSSNTATMEVYDIAGDLWSGLEPMPLGLDHHGMVELGGLLYVLGGNTRSLTGSGVVRDEMFVYNPVNDTWSPGPPLPALRAGGWAAAHSGRIYFVGGSDGAGVSHSSFYIFDTAVGGWSTGTPMTVARNHLNVVIHGGYLYAIGGRHLSTSYTAIERYDIANDSWQTMAPLPTARAAMACAVIDNKIYCAGGETPMLFAVNEVYDIASDTWSTDTPMPVPRHGVAAIALEDRMLVAGGGLIQGRQPTTHFDAFVPAPPGLGLTPAVAALSIAAAGFVAVRRLC